MMQYIFQEINEKGEKERDKEERKHMTMKHSIVAANTYENTFS